MRTLVLGATALAALVAGPALAADLPVRGPVYKSAPPVVYNWTGFYGGVNVGYSWGQQSNDWTVPGFLAISENQNMNGVIGGVQWGYNWQLGNWVIGTESDFQASGQRGSTTYCVIAGCGTDHHRRRTQAAVVRHLAYPHRLPAVAVLPDLCDRRSGIRSGEVRLRAVRGRRRRCAIELQGHPRRLHGRRRHRGRLRRRLERKARVSVGRPGHGHLDHHHRRRLWSTLTAAGSPTTSFASA